MVVIVSGKQGSGKTTTTGLLINGHFGAGHHIKFADPLYEMHEAVWDALRQYSDDSFMFWDSNKIIMSMHDAVWNVLERYGVPREKLSQDLYNYFGINFKRTPYSPREKKSGDLLQYLGTEFGRKRDENIWVNIAKRRIAKILKKDPNTLIVVDDCRFSNEFRELDEFDPIKVRLECDRDARKARTDGWRDNEYHKSETDLDHIAASGEFDIYFDTEIEPLQNVIGSIREAMGVKSALGFLSETATSFTNVSNKYYSKGFKKLEDGRMVGAW